MWVILPENTDLGSLEVPVAMRYYFAKGGCTHGVKAVIGLDTTLYLKDIQE